MMSRGPQRSICTSTRVDGHPCTALAVRHGRCVSHLPSADRARAKGWPEQLQSGASRPARAGPTATSVRRSRGRHWVKYIGTPTWIIAGPMLWRRWLGRWFRFCRLASWSSGCWTWRRTMVRGKSQRSSCPAGGPVVRPGGEGGCRGLG